MSKIEAVSIEGCFDEHNQFGVSKGFIKVRADGDLLILAEVQEICSKLGKEIVAINFKSFSIVIKEKDSDKIFFDGPTMNLLASYDKNFYNNLMKANKDTKKDNSNIFGVTCGKCGRSVVLNRYLNEVGKDITIGITIGSELTMQCECGNKFEGF